MPRPLPVAGTQPPASLLTSSPPRPRLVTAVILPVTAVILSGANDLLVLATSPVRTARGGSSPPAAVDRLVALRKEIRRPSG